MVSKLVSSAEAKKLDSKNQVTTAPPADTNLHVIDGLGKSPASDLEHKPDLCLVHDESTKIGNALMQAFEAKLKSEIQPLQLEKTEKLADLKYIQSIGSAPDITRKSSKRIGGLRISIKRQIEEIDAKIRSIKQNYPKQLHTI